MRKKLIVYGLFSALGEAAYIFLVALFMNSANKFFGSGPNILGMVIFLLIFVFSAAISGALILGKPILLYLDNKKPEAIKLFGFTLGWIFILLVILLILLLLVF
ncbi:MAG: hypothetical protein NTZ97_04610 [Candidatus Moranbacteria bacterium]|nr:hypothetical protein [Candidatus Moranbacteria bacterium]